MKHRGTARWALATIVVGVMTGALLGAGPAQANGVDQVTVTGIGLIDPLVIDAEEQPELCRELYHEVNWLGRTGTAEEPDPEALGPQFTLVAYVDGEPRHRFHLYPLSEDGPRVFRPAEQPGDRTAKEAWFFGRLGMPDTLLAAGVPVYDPDHPAAPGGGGGGDPAPGASEPPEERGLLAFLDEWVEGMQLAGAITVAILLGLGGVALLIRRKV